jgi:hypothetical protein
VVAWPGVPGTRGIRIGASNEPLCGSISWLGEGMARKKLSERGLYASMEAVCWRRRTERSDREGGSEKNIVLDAVDGLEALCDWDTSCKRMFNLQA